MVAHPAYVEDANDDFEGWRKFQVPGQLESEDDDDEENQPVNRLPEAPTPPPAVPTMPNVFDFLVNNPTPTASHVSLPATAAAVPQPNENNQLVRFDPEANGMADDPADDTAVVQYGNTNGNSNGSAPATNFETPAPKEVRRIVKDTGKESSGKKDKKRKRDLHIDVDMTDAPPVLHTGLTGGLSRMMSKSTVFPPSPDSYDAPEAETPASPLKKSKSKHHRSSRPSDSIGTSIMAMISGNSGKHKSSSSSKKRAKTQHKSNTSPSSKPKKKKTSSSHTKTLEAPKQPKLLEFRPVSKDGNKDGDSGALIVYKPPAEHFLSFVNKGPESERGCSVNKALKRYHRERSASGTSVNKVVEEKELWKSLRMKRNERGEIVLFTLDS
jgi:cell growth-regulating nucleolar protein